VSIELRQLRHLLAAIEHGSFVAAASACHITQSGLTRSIQHLEAAVGVPLLVRGPRGVQPTAYGQTLARHAHSLVHGADRAVGELRDLVHGHGGHLRLGIGSGLAPLVLPPVVLDTLERCPGLRIGVVEGTWDLLTELLATSRLDAVLCAMPEPPPPEIEHALLLSDPLVVVCRASEARGEASLQAAALASRRWALTLSPRALGVAFEQAFTRAGCRPPAPVLEVDSMAVLPALVARSDLVSLLPLSLVREAVRTGDLAILPQQVFRNLRADIGLLRKAGAPPAPGMEAFAASVATAFGGRR
jgi:DNA-binding transcriptional LysR family regulator